MKPGIYRGMPFRDYVAIDALNSSTLKTIHLDCLEQAAMDRGIIPGGEPRVETDAMRLGRALHDEVLEGREALLTPTDSAGNRLARRKGDNMAQWEAVEAAALESGRNIVSPAERAWLDAVPGAIHRVIPARQILAKTASEDRELTLLWEERGLLCKARLDGFIGPWKLAWDLKKSYPGSPSAFGRQAQALAYHIQAAWYLHGCSEVGMDVDEFAFVVVRTQRYPRCSVQRVPEKVMKKGFSDAMLAFDRYADAMRTGRWTGYGDHILDLAWPAWDLPREEESDDGW